LKEPERIGLASDSSLDEIQLIDLARLRRSSRVFSALRPEGEVQRAALRFGVMPVLLESWSNLEQVERAETNAH